VRLNPEIINPFTGKDADNLVINHFQKGEEGDDSMYAALASGKNIDKINPWFEYQFADDQILFFLDGVRVLDDGMYRIPFRFLAQEGWGAAAPFDPAQILSIMWSAKVERGSAVPSSCFDFWIDEVAFYSE